jgi:mono/diheme cytochrome c family protein
MTKTTAVMVILGGAFTIATMHAVVAAQAARSVNEGVYTAEQATRGEALYKETCAACHGDNLEGSGPMPPLSGKDFLANWQGKTVGDLYEKTTTSMPATAPGTLTPEQASDILAYMFSVGKYPAGTVALASKIEPLLEIKLDAPK